MNFDEYVLACELLAASEPNIHADVIHKGIGIMGLIRRGAEVFQQSELYPKSIDFETWLRVNRTDIVLILGENK